MALDGVFGECRLLETQAGDLLLKIVVVLAGVAEIDVVGPTVAKVVAEAVKEALERCHCGDGPVTDESNISAVWEAGFDGAADLDSKSEGLGKQDRNQDQNILEACEERFHALAMIIFEMARERR